MIHKIKTLRQWRFAEKKVPAILNTFYSSNFLYLNSVFKVGNEDIGQVSGEEKAQGRVDTSVYIRLFRAGSGIVFFVVFMTLNLAAQVW